MTYSIPLTHGAPSVELYNGAVAFSKPIVVSEAQDGVTVRISTEETGFTHDVAIGMPLHPGASKRGVYVEFFYLDSRGRRHWKTPSLLGFANDDWTANVSSDGDGTYTIEFKPF